MSVATVADLLLPVYSGRMVDSVTSSGPHRAEGLHSAIHAIVVMAILAAILTVARHIAWFIQIRLNLRLMVRLGSDAFWRVQRFSTD